MPPIGTCIYSHSHTCELCAAPATPRARGGALCRVCFEHASPEPTRTEERAWFPNLTGGFDAAPCPVCGGGDEDLDVLLFDSPCDQPFHARCVGFQGLSSGIIGSVEGLATGAQASAKTANDGHVLDRGMIKPKSRS